MNLQHEAISGSTYSERRYGLNFGWTFAFFLSFVYIGGAGCVPEAPTRTEPPAAEEEQGYVEYGYTVVAEYPHDTDAFTQGLEFHDGYLYEGTGLRGRSSLRKVDLYTGEVLQYHALDNRYFGEGITIFDDRIYQLTWTSNTGFVYDLESFELLDTFSYPTEGWGLTQDGERLIMSDGTDQLYFLNPYTYERIGSIHVHDDYGPVDKINELEFIDGKVYANIWKQDLLVIINPESGQVVGKVHLDGLLTPRERLRVDVLNGIAWDEIEERLFVTGKLWPKLFKIQLVELD